MKEKDISLFDQAITEMNRTIPGAMKLFYDCLIKEGFAEERAIYITVEWFKNIYAYPSSGGTRPPIDGFFDD